MNGAGTTSDFNPFVFNSIFFTKLPQKSMVKAVPTLVKRPKEDQKIMAMIEISLAAAGSLIWATRRFILI